MQEAEEVDQQQEPPKFVGLRLTAYTGNRILENSQQKRSYTKQHKL